MLRNKKTRSSDQPVTGRIAALPNGSLLPGKQAVKTPLRPSAVVHLTGSTARRATASSDQILWDDELPGFGLRLRRGGAKTWIIQHRRRGKQARVSLGCVGELSAGEARNRARSILAEAALDGMPRRERARGAAPTFADYVEPFWRDYARHWKPATQKRNRCAIERELVPAFGPIAIDALRRADVLRWRDEFADRQGVFNRTLPVLAVMLAYAEQLGHRPRGSNPCRGTPRYKRTLPERYLSAAEYRRLGRVLADAAHDHPVLVAVVHLLLVTGARVSEIAELRWDDVRPPRLVLPDSKTGPKTIYLNRPAAALLASLPRREDSVFVFPGRTSAQPTRAKSLYYQWDRLRRRAALPDVRLHDLRHSFASTAINANVSLQLIGGLLGHALPETTARYAHLADQSVADAARRVCGTVAGYMGVGR